MASAYHPPLLDLIDGEAKPDKHKHIAVQGRRIEVVNVTENPIEDIISDLTSIIYSPLPLSVRGSFFLLWVMLLSPLSKGCFVGLEYF
jgi:hypothetical protein